MHIPRYYHNLERYIKPSKALIIYGPRRVGKTTLLNDYLSTCKYKYKLDSGDNIKTQSILSSQDFEILKDYAAGYELIAIDEAQKIPDIGQGLKILVDQVPSIRVIATGSSSFELAGQVGEPLTGRKNTLTLLPIAQLELQKLNNKLELKEQLANFMIYGSYPDVINASSKKAKVDILEELVNSYLLKDILEIDRVKNTKILLDLLRVIAFQVGSEVSLAEIGSKLAIDGKTVARYLDLFEKSFILYNLRGFSRNLRKEVTKKSKYYFYDNGIRNTIVANTNGLDYRDDIGILWENFLISERLKNNLYNNHHINDYFWRTWDQKEIDYVEEGDGKLKGFEFKWSEKRSGGKNKEEWIGTYYNAQFSVINPSNYFEFVGSNKLVK